MPPQLCVHVLQLNELNKVIQSVCVCVCVWIYVPTHLIALL